MDMTFKRRARCVYVAQKGEREMSHPRQEDDRRLGDNDEAEPKKTPGAKRNSPVAKGEEGRPSDGENNGGTENTGLGN